MVALVDFPQAAVVASPDVLLIIDGDGILRWASPSLVSLGFDPVADLGLQVLDHVHPDDVGYALGMLTEAIRRPGEHSLPVFRGSARSRAHRRGRGVGRQRRRRRVRRPSPRAAARGDPGRASRPTEGPRAPLARGRGSLRGGSRRRRRLSDGLGTRELGEFHGASSVVLARSEAHGEMRIDHEWVAPGAVSALASRRDLGGRAAVGPSGPSRERLLDHLRCRRRAPRQVRHARHASRSLGVRAAVDVAIVDSDTTIGLLSIRWAHPARRACVGRRQRVTRAYRGRPLVPERGSSTGGRTPCSPRAHRSPHRVGEPHPARVSDPRSRSRDVTVARGSPHFSSAISTGSRA